MKNQLWILIVVVAFFLSALVGYNISLGTGVEPGYFEAPEAGGYGAGAGAAAPEGIDTEFQEYYQKLTE